MKKKGEAAKVAVRNIRRDANDAFKKLAREQRFPRIRSKDLEGQLQKMTDKFIADIDKADGREIQGDHDRIGQNR